MIVYHISPSKNRRSISKIGILRSNSGIDGPGVYVWIGDLATAIRNADISLMDCWDGDETKLQNLDVWKIEISDSTPTTIEWEDYIVLDVELIPPTNISMIGDFLEISNSLAFINNKNIFKH